MNQIHTIEDLMQILDENPAWLEAMRTRLLTRELIELPEKLTQLAAKVDSFIEATNQRFGVLEEKAEVTNQRLGVLEEKAEVTNQRLGVLEEKAEVTNQRLGVLEEKAEVTNQRLGVLEEKAEVTNQRLDKLETKVDGLETKVDGLDSKVQSIQDSVGVLKGAHARSAALRRASSIAREMGLQRTKNLTDDDLWALVDLADTVDIPTNELRSFREADLIMEATDSDGETCYIAVEISFTANGRDTRRAIRNAELLTKFTGKPAHAAIAGLHRDDRIQTDIESGKVFWYQLDPKVLEAE